MIKLGQIWKKYKDNLACLDQNMVEYQENNQES